MSFFNTLEMPGRSRVLTRTRDSCHSLFDVPDLGQEVRQAAVDQLEVEARPRVEVAEAPELD